MKEIFCAAKLVPAIGQVVDQGALAVEDGKVLASGPISEVRQLAGEDCSMHDLGDTIIFPGLVNAHCHLDYTFLRGALLPQTSFTTWLDRVGRMKRTLADRDIAMSIGRGLREAAAAGTTSLCSISSFPEVLLQLPPPALRVWWFYELSDLRNRLHPDELIQGALMFFDRHPRWQGGFGLSPHAPYSTSQALYELTRLCVAKYEMPWCTHVAESREEWEMFQHGRGRLYDFLHSLGRNMSDSGGTSPLRRIFGGETSPGNGLLVHLNYLDGGDWDLLRQWGQRTRVIHCPSSHRFFGHDPFPFERLRECGARIALATDSGATGGSLDLRREMRIFAEEHPEVSLPEVWRMVTEIPASFLGQQTVTGRLQRGAAADFCLFSQPGHLPADEVWQFLLQVEGGPQSVYVGGKLVTEQKHDPGESGAFGRT